jgi:exonuclease VII small subunit
MSMSSLAWGALGFFLFVLLAGIISVTFAALRLWRRVKSFRAAGNAMFGDLRVALTMLEGHTRSLERGSTDLERVLRRLDRSLRRGRKLLAAWRDARRTVSGWFGFLPGT